MKFGNRTYKKLQKIYGSNESGLLSFVNQFDAFKNDEITLQQFIEELKLSTPTELDTVKVLQRHLSPEDQARVLQIEIPITELYIIASL